MSSSISKIEHSHTLFIAEPPKKEEKQEKSTVLCYQGISLKHIQNPVTMEEFVKTFVEAFLHPYITGHITKEMETKERKPMIEELFSELEKRFPEESTNNKERIETIACDHYLFCATQGLYVHCKKHGGETIAPESEGYDALVIALTEALPKDFPHKLLSQEELRKRVADVLQQVNIRRLCHYQEFLSEKSTERPASDRRIQILEQIKATSSSALSLRKNNLLDILRNSLVSYCTRLLFPPSLRKISSLRVDEISSEIL